VSGLNPFGGDAEGAGAAGSPSEHDTAPTVEEILEGGQHFFIPFAERHPVDIALRGIAGWESVRCEWRGTAAPTQQREEFLRGWLFVEGLGHNRAGQPLPPAVTWEALFYDVLGLWLETPVYSGLVSSFLSPIRGGLFTEIQLLACYVDYQVQEYLLGAGPPTVTVAYDGLGSSTSYEIYKKSLEIRASRNSRYQPPQDEAEYARRLQQRAAAMEALLAQIIGGRENVVFLAPMGAGPYGSIAVESWQAVAQWDLQVGDDGLVEAVRYATPRGDPEYRQPLDELSNRIETAGATDAFAGKRIANIDGLRAYYESVGAYEVIGPYNIPRSERTPFKPATPPPPYDKPREMPPAPAPVPYVAPTFVSISSGSDHTCGLGARGSAICWGNLASPSPDEVFTAISSGDGRGGDYVCGLRPDNAIGCWGSDYRGQSSPPEGRFRMVNSGWEYTCALREDGSAECWGDDEHGKASPPEGVKFTAIGAGSSHACGLTGGGAPVCWGYDGDGRASPPAGVQLASITVGSSHACGLRADGVPVCWGSNLQAQSVAPDGSRFTTISAGGRHTCALEMDGTAVCWGANASGQSTSPPGERFASISSGGSHSCGLRENGNAVCWGDNDGGQASAPGPLEAYTHITAGSNHSCALRKDGFPVCWGEEDFGATRPPEGV